LPLGWRIAPIHTRTAVWTRHLVEQRADLRAIVVIIGGQPARHDLTGVGVHAEMQFSPGPACPRAMLLDQPFAGTSMQHGDAAIVSGLIAMLLRVYSGRTPDETAATDPVFLKELGLIEALPTNRGNGIASMAKKIREAARQPAAA